MSDTALGIGTGAAAVGGVGALGTGILAATVQAPLIGVAMGLTGFGLLAGAGVGAFKLSKDSTKPNAQPPAPDLKEAAEAAHVQAAPQPEIEPINDDLKRQLSRSNSQLSINSGDLMSDPVEIPSDASGFEHGRK